MSIIRLVTFDVTGTLLKVSVPVGTQYSQVAEKYLGLKLDENLMQNSFWKFYRQQMKEFPIFGSQHNIDSKQWWFSVFSNCINENRKIPAKDVQKIKSFDSKLKHAFEDVFYNFEWSTNTGAEETLKCLKSMENEKFGTMKLAAISNSDERTSTILKKTKLLQYFDCVVTSVEAKCEKPDPRIFDHTLHKLNLSSEDKKHVLHVGNMLEKDYLAATKAGLQALLLRDESNEKETLYHEDHSINNLIEVVSYVKRNNECFPK